MSGQRAYNPTILNVIPVKVHRKLVQKMVSRGACVLRNLRIGEARRQPLIDGVVLHFREPVLWWCGCIRGDSVDARKHVPANEPPTVQVPQTPLSHYETTPSLP